MERLCIQLPLSQTQNAIELSDFIKLIEFLRETSIDFKKPEFNELSSRPYLQINQFQLKPKIPLICKKYQISPNNNACIIQLINNCYLLVQNSKIQYLKAPRDLFDIPDNKTLKKLKKGQNNFDLTLQSDQDSNCLAISDMGDCYIQTEHLQYYFSQQSGKCKLMSLFQQQTDIFISRQNLYTAIFPPQSQHMTEPDKELIISHIQIEKGRLLLELLLIDDGVLKSRVQKKISPQNQQEDIYLTQQCLLNTGRSLLVIINENLFQVYFDFTQQSEEQLASLDKQLSPVCSDNFTKQKVYLQRLNLLKFIKNNSATQQLVFIKFVQSADSNLITILFKDFIILFSTPTLFSLIKIQSFDSNNTDLVINQNRNLILKMSQSSFIHYEINLQFDKQGLVIHPDRFYQTSINATILQTAAQDLSKYNYEDLTQLICFLMHSITDLQAIVLLSKQSHVVQQILSEQYQIDLLQVQLVQQIILKFVQMSIMQVRVGVQVNMLQLLKFKDLVNSYNNHPLMMYIAELFQEQFSQYYIQKYNMVYFLKQLECYSLDDYDKSIYQLNFEDNYNAACQIIAVSSIYYEMNLRQKQYVPDQLLIVAALLFALSRDIQSMKQMNIPQVILEKYCNLLKVLGFAQLSALPQIPQLPALLLLTFNSNLRLFDGAMGFKPVFCPLDDLFQTLLISYQQIVDASHASTVFKLNKPIYQYKSALLCQSSAQPYLIQLKNAPNTSDEFQFYLELLLKQENYQLLLNILLDENASRKLQQLSAYFKQTYQFSTNGFSFNPFLIKLIKSVSLSQKQFAGVDGIINITNLYHYIQQDKYSGIFTPYALAIVNKEVIENALILAKESHTHAIRYLDNINNQFELEQTVNNKRNPLHKKIIQLRAILLEQKGLFLKYNLKETKEHEQGASRDLDISELEVKNNLKSTQVVKNLQQQEQSSSQLRQQTFKDQESVRLYQPDTSSLQSSLAPPKPAQQGNAFTPQNIQYQSLQNNMPMRQTAQQVQQNINPQQQYQYQFQSNDESGIALDLLQQCDNYDPQKEISMQFVEGNQFIEQKQYKSQIQIPHPLPQSQFNQSNMASSSRPIEIRRIRVSDLANPQQSIQNQQASFIKPRIPPAIPPQNQQHNTTNTIPPALNQFQDPKQQFIPLSNEQNSKTYTNQQIPVYRTANIAQFKPQNIQTIQYNQSIQQNNTSQIKQPTNLQYQPFVKPQTNVNGKYQVPIVNYQSQNYEQSKQEMPRQKVQIPIFQQPVQQQQYFQPTVQYQQPQVQYQQPNIQQQQYQAPIQQQYSQQPQYQQPQQVQQQYQQPQYQTYQQPIQAQPYQQQNQRNQQQYYDQPPMNNQKQQLSIYQQQNEQYEVPTQVVQKPSYKVHYVEKSFKKQSPQDLQKIEGIIGPGVNVGFQQAQKEPENEYKNFDFIQNKLNQYQPYSELKKEEQPNIQKQTDVQINQFADLPNQQTQAKPVNVFQSNIQNNQKNDPVVPQFAPSVEITSSVIMPQSQIQYERPQYDFKQYDRPQQSVQPEISSSVVNIPATQVQQNTYNAEPRDDVMDQIDQLLNKAKLGQQQTQQFINSGVQKGYQQREQISYSEDVDHLQGALAMFK
ncbi:Conserved_hypothetical protein [Hexamita inflata]|uniref:Uncharacterized protein n=1 Tax=Hexamita inflata TaxID=28002 RepID=A0ABP1GXE9_9EUKA